MTYLGLPNWRAEKAAICGLRKGYTVEFAGNSSPKYSNKIFSEIFAINWTAKARWGIPFYWDKIKNRAKKILKSSQPDIVHAHDLFTAKLISELKIPFVYDDYEFWSKYAIVLSEVTESSIQENFFKSKIKKFLQKRAIILWKNWEKNVISYHPTITVSDAIASELKSIGNTQNVFIVPNFPLKSESGMFGDIFDHEIFSSVYAGSDKIGKANPPFRNLDNLTSFFQYNDIGKITLIGMKGNQSDKIKYTGFISRKEMFEEMRKHSVGLIPWKKHWSHYYLNPNKYAEYAHAGLFVMCTSSLQTIIDTLKNNCVTFENYEDMVDKLTYFKNNMDDLYNKRIKTYEFAKENLIWDKYEENIIRAYKLA
jgi:glycosyltransferase involved in cell wall biosynthesis